ncbi:MAG: dihydrolipoamide acetyltransferase family protein [Proteobacteria bacterium]|nr:dihydrolipoamide acetyltransferase family protein [Pseudomonadota bacterium]MDA1064077.1 dihydrolipoamide acetyltransferase family protein [Pseudomonadota bacterium]
MNVLMPQLGETVTEGTVAAWHKQAGDAIEKGDMLLDVETDKVTTEITAPATGVLSSIAVPEGDTVDVGTVLAVIAVEGEAVESVTDAPVTAVSAAAVPSAAPASGGLGEKSFGEKLSPAVRRLLKQNNLDIADISGTGRDGRVTRQDVMNHIEAGSAPPTGVKRIPFDRVRKVTAAHMVRSKATSPHVLQAIDADFTAIDDVRLVRKAQWKSDKGYSLTYLAFVARAVAIAIKDFPNINASVGDNELLVHSDLNLAIAVNLDHAGLVAPVVRNAAALSVSNLAERFNNLATRAKANKLTADDLQGGTYTLSNPGPFGTLFTAPIINQPQVGILSMDAVRKRAHVVERESGDAIEIRPVGILAHSFDHRAIDGAYSAAYLQRLKSLIENTDWNSEM